VCVQSRQTWRGHDGASVVLSSPLNLLQLSELERLTLQKVALARLHAFQLGTKINIPKGAPTNMHMQITKPGQVGLLHAV